MFKERVYCGELRKSDVGKKVLVTGWVDQKRDLGGLVFIELRDVSGVVQAVIKSNSAPDVIDHANQVRDEFCLMVRGTVVGRSAETINLELGTGEIEVEVESLDILNTSPTTLFPIDARNSLNEEIRLKYRYLDLRRKEMRDAVIARHRVMQVTRNYLSEKRFIEIETPMLNKSTPEGARDFLVPSRISKGMFYALPQSPQLFKQILMISGFDRYFQIVKCFRDEDLRNDRQPEFTQIDLEMSFVDREMVMDVIEGLLRVIVKDIRGLDITLPFPRLAYDEAMERYGKDAPDTRFGLELRTVSDLFGASQFNVFSSILAEKGIIKGIAVEDGGALSRKMIDDYVEYAKVFRAKGLPWVRYKDGAFEGGIAKFLSDGEKESLVGIFGLKANSVLFFSADSYSVVNDTLAALRVKIGRDLELIDEDRLDFLWVTDFPLLEYDEGDGRFYAKHHPFTSPFTEHLDLLKKIDPAEVDKIKAQAYDVVLNGSEIGGGSIRISNPDVQSMMFSVLGISEEEARVKFSFLLDALKYGAPPHGGIALGLDRIMMLLLKKASIRDVIPFPKTQKGQCLMSVAPSPVSQDQLKELSIKLADR
mgnify:CR=1 FL=1